MKARDHVLGDMDVVVFVATQPEGLTWGDLEGAELQALQLAEPLVSS